MPEELRFDGRVVIVTGAGAGLGRAYALLFAARGASVVVNDLGSGRHGDGSNTKIADTVVEEIRRNGGKAVANYDSVLDGDKIVKTAIDAFGRIDILVNNAGILRDKSFIKMTETDWDLVQNVHLKGAFKTTRAAWPYFMKQKYGRVIFTASNSGLYGNFGQANYSSAKMGLVGLVNTLAIEGVRKNTLVNVLVPTAASRLTEDILPPDLFNQLKPELIAPVVVWLCHEKCTENGSIIESAVGWAGKCHLIRSSGSILRQNLNDSVTPENVQKNWGAITDMTNAKHLESIQEATGGLLNVIEELKSGAPRKTAERNAVQTSYNQRDIILYALGVGASTQSVSDFCYLYENHEKFSVLPTFYVLFAPMGCFELPLMQEALPNVQLSPTNILHGEQYLEIYKPIPIEAKVETRFKVLDVLDKGRGAVVLVQHDTLNTANGELLSTGQMSIFVMGAGGFQGKRMSSNQIPTIDPPKRKPDVSINQQTSIDQAALYRLSGDMNPLHIDPNVATMAGFERPILHGLCSLGFSTRHVLQAFADGDPSLFKSIKVRFVKPVLPGQTLRTEMWQEGNRIHFQTLVNETNTPVITGAYIDLHSVKAKTQQVEKIPIDSGNLQSDAVFTAIQDYVKSHRDEVKKVNAVFLYNITVDGKQSAQWTLDLKNCDVFKGQPKSGKADTTLTIEDKDMMEIALGKLNPQSAFMKGKLKISGNIMITQKLKTLLETSKAKL